MENSRISIVLIAILGVFVLFSSPSFVHAQDTKMSIIPIDSRPYNRTYGEWSVNWWLYLMQFPKESSPAGDNTGALCAKNQDNEHVWFLVGTFGGAADRSCTVPSNKSIFFPLLNNECSILEFPKLKAEAELTSCARQPMDKVVLQLSIDGQDIKNLTSYRVTSSLFNVTFPDNNVFGVDSGPTQAVSDGYFVMLKPFPAGEHQIKFSGIRPDVSLGSAPEALSSQLFANEVAYKLHVR
jgi:hypothetical protein